MYKQKLKLFLFFFLLVPLAAYTVDVPLKNEATNNSLDDLVKEDINKNLSSQQQPVTAETKQENFMGKLNGFTQSFKDNGGYLDIGLRYGYMDGYTAFDFNHHTSELEYPFRTLMGGGKIDVGYKDFSINSEFWGSLNKDIGWNMKDKDWHDNGEIYSDTQSKTNMNAVIWDANLRYNLLKYSFSKDTDDSSPGKLKTKLGLLVGFRYQRFGYDMYGLRGTSDSDVNEKSLTYKIKYELPYYGMAMDIGNDKFGISLGGKYGFCPTIKDQDYHVLRGLTFYGDYNSHPNIFMTNLNAYWRFAKNWEFTTGGDVSFIRLDGRARSANNDPAWNKDQSTDTKQFLYWIGLGYRF